MNKYHTTVLLQEAVEGLRIKQGKKYIDATLGGGGHTREILRLGGVVLGIDADNDAISYVSETFPPSTNLVVTRGNFKDIDRIAKEAGFENIAGVLFDLGVSGHQLDIPERGFSIRGNGPLDMRMDDTLAVRASDLVNGLTRKELEELFFTLGEERFTKKIVERIIKRREEKHITTTEELKEIVEKAVFLRGTGVHPATRIFQALRIAVNGELYSLKEALPKALSLLEKSGRLAVISFHSLEDRIVKDFFNEMQAKGKGKVITKKPIIPTEDEIQKNARSRSAKLRIFEKE